MAHTSLQLQRKAGNQCVTASSDDFSTGFYATLEGSSMGYLSLPYSQESAVFPVITRVSDLKESHESHAVSSRRKRNILFPSGVKLCAQETVQQVVANHLSYFHLRVCQETIWEAFKIFWDRLPEQEEYQSWMNKCQEGTATAQDIGSYFSQSEEHDALVKKRMPRPAVSPPGPGNICAEDTAKEEEVEEAAVTQVEESPLNNDIAMEPPTLAVLEQVVELSILLTGEMYSDSLDDPASLQYQTLSRQLAEKIEDALEGLPGFKSVSVLDFRPEKDTQGLDGVVVDYAVTVVVNGAGVSNEQLDYLTLQLNRVENSYREVMEHPTMVYTISEVKNYVTDTLHRDNITDLSEVPEPVNAADGAATTPVQVGDELTSKDQINAADEPSEVTILEEESEAAATEENEVIVLEESAVVSPAPVLITSAPEAGTFEEEGLLLEDTVQTPAVETPPPEELPAELPAPELPEDVTLPEPPVEIEASDTISEAETEEVEVAAVGEEPTTLEQEHLYEVVTNEIPKELEISTIASETVEEESLPALVPPPEAVDVESEASEPEAAETGLIPVDEDLVESTEEESNLTDVPPADEEVNPEQPAEDADIIVALTTPEEAVFEEAGVEEATEIEGEEVKEETLPEAPAVEEEAPAAPELSTEDLTEDEIILVNQDEPEPPVIEVLSPAKPTALSPERESPFTRISDVHPATEGLPDVIIPSLVEIQTTNEGLDDASTGDLGNGVITFGFGLINHTEEGSTGFPSGVAHGTDQVSIAMPANPGRALMVFFSLRVTNMIFSDDLFNKSSPEYKALEQRFLELLVPYLQSNLSHFENLEILNFRNGSIVVNSRMKFGKPVQQGVTTTVYLILEDFCNTAYQTMNLAIDKYSLDVESGDQADPCKFQACNEYAECKVNKWSGEAECVCNAGYFSVDGLPCQSICELRTDFCLNDGKCDIIPGQGAICRCRVGENWWYRGEHCEEYVSEPLVVGIAIASVAGFLLVASGVIFFLARTLRDQYDKDESEDPIRRAESLPSLERATKYNPMYESEATTGYSHYYRRYPEAPVYSSASAEASTDFSSEEIRHIYENSELTKEEIQDRIRIIELYAKDRQFADFVRQHQAVLDTRRESSST
ncbi:interphotoreceptor matrix proteoglycan 2 [Pagrus major]|uniref:interphotoreceptor matrix proteoglycan 2 n=1 Tax=Pagrus major TaxID=143350 RepID=UPI003CC87A74